MRENEEYDALLISHYLRCHMRSICFSAFSGRIPKPAPPPDACHYADTKKRIMRHYRGMFYDALIKYLFYVMALTAEIPAFTRFFAIISMVGTAKLTRAALHGAARNIKAMPC